MPFAARIDTFAVGDARYGGTGLQYDPEAVVVWWSGEVPAEMSEIVDETAAAGVVVTIIDSPYGGEELTRLSLQLGRALSDGGVQWSTVSPTAAYDGIVVSGPSLSTDAAAVAAVREIAASVIGEVPLSIGPDTPMVVAAATAGAPASTV